MKEIYNEVAKNAAKFVWQATSMFLPQIGIWFAADKTGNLADWALGNKKPASEKKSFFSRLNPVSTLKSLNPISFLSFAARPFSRVKKALSWLLLEEVAYKMNDHIQVPFKKVAPIAEKFLTPILEKLTTPVVDYLKDNNLMQFPKPEVVCPVVTACPNVCDSLPELEIIAEVAKSSSLAETASNAWNYMTQPLSNIMGTAASTVVDTAANTPLHQVFEEIVEEPIVEVVKPIVEVVKQKAPQGYFELTEHYAEPAGRYIAETMSSTYRGVTGMIQKNANVTDALDQSTQILADAIGVNRGWIIAAGVGATAITACAGYALWNRGWTRNTAVANANASANAQGGQANGNNVQFLVQFPAMQGAVPAQGQVAVPMNAESVIPVVKQVDASPKM